MSNNKRIMNLTRGYSMKFKQALHAIEQCAASWVEYGVSIRDLSLQESIEARNKQSKEREPLPLSEIPGIKFDPPANALNSNRQSSLLAYEAGKFAAMGA